MKMCCLYKALLLALYSLARVVPPLSSHYLLKREITPHIRNGTAQFMSTAVSIFLDHTPVCSGTILSEDTIITAGHCFDSIENLETEAGRLDIVAGEGDLISYLTGKSKYAEELKVKTIHRHPRYEHVVGKKLVWDLAILKLATKIPIGTNPKIDSAILPFKDRSYDGSYVRVGGWGRVSAYSGGSPVHLVIDVNINPDNHCSDQYKPGEFIPSQMFCLGNTTFTTCLGDSGAGDRLICKIFHKTRGCPAENMLYGITYY